MSGWADAVWDQGRRFGTIGFKKDGRTYEITTHRAEAYVPESRKPDVAVRRRRRGRPVPAGLHGQRHGPGPARRPSSIDPFGGLADLAASRLRTPLAPEESFSDDPLRMLRAARFLAGYELEPEPELVGGGEGAAGPAGDRLGRAHPRRARQAAWSSSDPAAGLWFLVDTGLAEEFLPELPALGLEQDPIHRHKDVLAHTIAVVEKTSPDRILRLAALLHDVGKPKTRSIGPGGVSFHHHEVVGARMAEERMRALRYPTDDIEAVSRLVELHLRFHGYGTGWTDSAVRRYVRDAGPLLEQLNELTRCDCTTRNKRTRRRRWPSGWTSSRSASPSCGSRRSSTASAPTSTAARSWSSST